MDPAHAVRVDAAAPGLGPADVIFVFGTRLRRPAELAADLFLSGHAPFVVLTGGSSRQADGLNEAEHHRDVLISEGVPESSLIVENTSSNTTENVLLALPLIEDRCGQLPKTVIAVVKRMHRRAIITLTRYAPSVERVYAVTYEPETLSPGRFEREMAYLDALEAEGVDLLTADGDGWRPSG